MTLSAPFLVGVIPKGADIRDVRVIAGAGTSSALREAFRLAELYGGELDHWVKKGGIVETINFVYDVHWYERDGAQYEQKIKPKPTAKENK